MQRHMGRFFLPRYNLTSVRQPRRRGAAYIMTLIVVVILAGLGVSLSESSSTGLQKAVNQGEITNAINAVDSGMALLKYHLQAMTFTATDVNKDIISLLGENMPEFLNVQVDATQIVIPEFSLDHGKFSAMLTKLASDSFEMEVTGRYGQAIRRASLNYSLQIHKYAVLDYGIATKGSLSLSGNPSVVGISDPAVGTIMSATEDIFETSVTISGNVLVSGDVYAAGETGDIEVTGNPSIAGTSDNWEAHVHENVTMPEFPEVDVSDIAALATTTYTGSSGGGNGKGNGKKSAPTVYTNIRIPPNTDPTFNSDVTLQGVIYIESPNVVKFNGHASLTGIIVTEDGDDPNDLIHFNGQFSTAGVESLPDTPEFEDVKKHVGSFILAPGFKVKINGGSDSAAKGILVADSIEIRGNADVKVYGSIIGLKDGVVNSIGGNGDIIVERYGSDTMPAGLQTKYELIPDGSSYDESMN